MTRMVTDLYRIPTYLPFPQELSGNNADEEIRIFLCWLVILCALLQVSVWPRHAFSERERYKEEELA